MSGKYDFLDREMKKDLSNVDSAIFMDSYCSFTSKNNKLDSNVFLDCSIGSASGKKHKKIKEKCKTLKCPNFA